MSYIGKAVKVQARVATGHGGVRSLGKGLREQIPVPTELRTFDAIVIGESRLEGYEPHLTVIFKKDDQPLNSVEMQSGFTTLYDVPHQDHEMAEGAIFWFGGVAEAQVETPEVNPEESGKIPRDETPAEEKEREAQEQAEEDEEDIQPSPSS